MPAHESDHNVGVHPEAHEHPNPWLRDPLVAPDVFATIREAVTAATPGFLSRRRVLNQAVDRLEEDIQGLDVLAGLAPYLVAGDGDAVAFMRAAVGAPAEPSAHREEVPATELPVRLLLWHGEGGPGRPLDSPPSIVDRSALFDLVIGAAFAALADDPLRAVHLDTALGRLNTTLPVLESVHTAAVRFLGALDGPERLLLTLDGLLGRRPLPPIPNEFAMCLGAIRQAVGSPRGALASAMRRREADVDPLTQRITSVTPAAACAGTTIVLAASAQQPFGPRPAGLQVLFAPCGVPGDITAWQDTAVTVRVPQAAQTGLVYFGRQAGDDPAAALAFATEFQAMRDACPFMGGARGSVMVQALSLGPLVICSDLFVPVGIANRVTIHHLPEIASFTILANGKRVEVTTPVPRCQELVVSWVVKSDDGSVPQVALHRPGQAPQSGLPAAGSLKVLAERTEVFELRARNGCGEVFQAIQVAVTAAVTLSPAPLSMVQGTTAMLTLSTPCPVIADTQFTLVASDPVRIGVPPAATIPAGSKSVSVSVTGLLAGSPRQAVGTISVTAAGYALAVVPVWVEQPVGSWDVRERLGMIAIHAALLRTGKVLFFAGDEADYNAIEKGKSELWDPAARTVTPVVLPKPRNLFCSGHALLPDGRLLVAGGHAFGWLFGLGHGVLLLGRGADHDVHTFDPLTERWARHADMRDARWYPTCVTLPDGRVLVVSGAHAGAPGKPFYKGHPNNWLGAGLNRNTDIFDPATNTMAHTRSPHFLSDWDFDLYPFLLVLPGGAVFVHSRRKTWLFYPDSSGRLTPSPNVYTTQSPNWRTYPVPAGCVLLPLRPSEPNRVRILIVGGADERRTTQWSDVPATNTAEIFDFDPTLGSAVAQSGWRGVPKGSPAPIPMFNRRFMSDAVLLPDGSVLVVSGVGKGIADDNADPVRQAELFDSQSETWRQMDSMQINRRYHATALLLPDATVAVAGSTGNWPPDPATNEYDIEVFSPPYLTRGPQPVISSCPSQVTHGQTFSLGTPNEPVIGRVVLIRASSVTHTNNTDQRCVELVIASRGAGQLMVTAPPDGSVAPPGYYMVFLMDQLGVPSNARFLRIASD